MSKIGLLSVAFLLLAGLVSFAGADVNGTLGANTSQDYKVNLQEGAYTMEFAAPGLSWLANVTYISYG